jgi:hypothetical protein
MVKLKWVDTSFNREFYTSKFNRYSGQVLGNKAFLNIKLLAQELGITSVELRHRMREMGYVETGTRLEHFSEEMYVGSKYAYWRPGMDKYPELIDCSSFVCGVYAELGIDLPRYTIHQIEIGKSIEVCLPETTNLETGDLLFFDEDIRRRWESESGIKVTHVMLHLGGGKVADASIKNRRNTVMVRDIDEVVTLGRKHVATRRYIKDFARLVNYENRTGQEVEDFEDLRERLINSNDEEK